MAERRPVLGPMATPDVSVQSIIGAAAAETESINFAEINLRDSISVDGVNRSYDPTPGPRKDGGVVEPSFVETLS